MIAKWTFGAVVAGMLVAGASAAAEPDSLLSQIKERGSIVICEAAYPPYNVKNPKSGDWEGLDVDLEGEIAKDLGVKIQRVDTSFAGLIPSINTHKCDLSTAATYITPARAEQVLFTRPFAAETKTVFVPATSNAKTYEDIDKPGITIVTRAGTAEETYAKHFFKHATIKVLTSDATQPHLLEVAAGRADAAFAGYVGSLIFMKQNPNLKLRPLGDKLLDPTPFAFMLPRGEYHFQQYLDVVFNDLERSGKLKEITDKWMSSLK
ncbi:MAG TPA: ABC transporter substrate-binding protein [Casimicrobiaceae bacterium]|jgi:ABC-type amino acid transport substrate-binding protein|nr:ABC transporter substrate-binding protein [Casimicrobiaceae bacterium]